MTVVAISRGMSVPRHGGIHLTENAGSPGLTDPVWGCRWRFQLQRMGDKHWVSVARGPVEDIVDAWKGLTNTFNVPHPTPEQYQVPFHCTLFASRLSEGL